jgi:hypothetical protein
VGRLKTLLTICKLEGDAVFAFTPGLLVVRGETLFELIETTYVDFRERMKNVRRHTTCTCRACQSIPILDLKFILHYGDFVVQNISGTRELAGSDVNLTHRLLKNHVAENTGWRAYALFTQKSLERMQLPADGLAESTESYEHLGEVRTFTVDMHARYEMLMEKRQVVVQPEEAILSFSEEIPGSPPYVWSWMNEPEKRKLYSLDPHRLRFIPILRPGGRTGVGATTHCVHGKDIAMRETVLDWKPFDYYTVRQESSPMGAILVTFKLEALPGNRTRVQARLKGDSSKWPAILQRAAIKFIYTRIFDYRLVLTKMKEVINEQPLEIDPVETAPESSLT